MTHTLHTSTVHKTALLAVKGNSAFCQSSGAANFFFRQRTRTNLAVADQQKKKLSRTLTLIHPHPRPVENDRP